MTAISSSGELQHNFLRASAPFPSFCFSFVFSVFFCFGLRSIEVRFAVTINSIEIRPGQTPSAHRIAHTYTTCYAVQELARPWAFRLEELEI